MRKFTVLMLLAAGCTYTPAYSDLTCDSEGATRDGQRCEGGVWVVDESATNNGVGDTGTTGGGDPDGGGGDPDMGGGDPDMSTCSAESDSVFCDRLGFTCEEATAPDNCGDTRTADCGSCDPDTEACNANVCELVPETDQELCAEAAATCGVITVTDRTGAERMPDCGMCTSPLECGADGTPNACSCPEADNAAFCAANNANCGAVTAMDPICGVERTVNCGMCTAPESCGGGGEDNVCGCMESDAEFCARLGANCGEITADDICGDSRSINCGSCADPMQCGAGGTDNVCGCDPVAVCAAASAQCGVLDVTGQCDNINSADCGGCGSGTCDTGAYVCMCDDGYEFNGTTCADIDECGDAALNDCDQNATCTNIAGGFECNCNPPYAGNGQTCDIAIPQIAEMVSVAADGSVTGVTLTTPSMNAVDDDLYVAFVAIRGSGEVTGISGLGLTWSRAENHCSADNDHELEVWTARGNASSNGTIDIDTSINWAAAAVVYRVTNVPSSGDTGSFETHNSRGEKATCSNPDGDTSYSFEYNPAYARSLYLVGTTMNDADHNPGTGWTEDEELHESRSGNDTSLATMHRDGGATVDVAGTFSSSENWISTIFEVRGL